MNKDALEHTDDASKPAQQCSAVQRLGTATAGRLQSQGKVGLGSL